jgi:flagellar hook-length control protein FliK
MKNISLQTTPAAALKTTANKSESNNDKSVSTEPSAFKTMLTNQLQNQSQVRQLQDRKSIDKRSQDRQLQDRQLQDRQIREKQLQARQDLGQQNVVKPELATSVQKSQLTSSPQSPGELAAKVGAEQDSVAQISAAKALVDNAAVMATSVAKTETALTDAASIKVATPDINAAETNAGNLIAAFNVAVVNPQAQAQIAEAAGFRQKNIDNVVSQTLEQSKAAGAADKDALQVLAESKGSTQKADLLEGGLPTALRQAVGDALTQSKVQQAGVQQNLVQQNMLQQANAQQSSLQQNSTQQSSIQQNLAQQAVNIAATMPTALQANAAAGPALATAQAASSNYINTPLGKSGWDQAISQKVMWMAGGGVQSATLTLNPPDLGPLQVVINVNNDMVEAKFMSDNADVRQALQDGLVNLRDKMNEAGMQLGQTNISAGGQAQQEFQQAQQGRRGERMGGNDTMATTVAAQSVNIRTANGLVDTFA